MMASLEDVAMGGEEGEWTRAEKVTVTINWAPETCQEGWDLQRRNFHLRQDCKMKTQPLGDDLPGVKRSTDIGNDSK